MVSKTLYILLVVQAAAVIKSDSSTGAIEIGGPKKVDGSQKKSGHAADALAKAVNKIDNDDDVKNAKMPAKTGFLKSIPKSTEEVPPAKLESTKKAEVVDPDAAVDGAKALADLVDPKAGGNAGAMEKQLTDLLMGAGGAGGTPMGESIKEIERVIQEEMIDQVTAAHESNQKKLLEEVDAINECSATKNEQVASAKKVETIYLATGPKHKLCRAGEAGKFTEKRDVHAEMKDKLKIKQLKCREFATAERLYATQKNNAEVVKKGGSEENESYVRRITTTFCGQPNTVGKGGAGKKGFLDEFLIAKMECEKATQEHNHQVSVFKTVSAQYAHEKATCNSLQDRMDFASCHGATKMKDACETYSECHMDRKHAHESTVKMVKMEEHDRKAEWRGLKRMQCLIVAFKDGKVKNSEIKACKNTHHSTDHLIIKYPQIPHYQKCTIPELYPSTPAYKLAEFAPLPAYAKGKESAACVGIVEINTDPVQRHDGEDPHHCKCERVTLNGPYTAGALVKCTKCRPIQSTRDKDSCPEGTKLFSPRSELDWKTIYSSTELMHQGMDMNKTDFLIVDVTSQHPVHSSPMPMDSALPMGRIFQTKDHSPWFLRSTVLMDNGTMQPTGGHKGYEKGCYIGVYLNTPESPERNLTFAAKRCLPPQDSYYCQPQKELIVPKEGSPEACKCSSVVLAGSYSAGALIKCENCLDVHKSTQKNSCPMGTKIFSPSSRQDWKTFLASAGPLRSPNWIIDVTRPQNGCGGCKEYPMKGDEPAQMTWKTTDGSPWWLRSNTYSEPSGDYHANCYMALWKTPESEQNIMFNDENCKAHSNAYYCQPVKGGGDLGMTMTGTEGTDGGYDPMAALPAPPMYEPGMPGADMNQAGGAPAPGNSSKANDGEDEE